MYQHDFRGDAVNDRDWLISMLTIEQGHILTDYEVHPDAWKNDPERTESLHGLADCILERLGASTLAALEPTPTTGG